MSAHGRRGYAHAEAFCIMWYSCPCGHRERMWNSRDGVTPFNTSCPSCGGIDFAHSNFDADVHSRDHKPHPGQRVWVDMTPERARVRALQTCSVIVGWKVDQEIFETMVLNALHGPGMAGTQQSFAPDLAVTGYAHD